MIAGVEAALDDRPKASARNIHAGVYLTDGEHLYEVVACRGVKALKVGANQIPMIEAVKLVDAAKPVPDALARDLRQGAWVPFEEVLSMLVVEPADSAD